MKKFLCAVLCALLIFALLAGCSKAEPLPFTGSDYSIPELDLSTMPEEYANTQYKYLYDLTVVDN